MGKAAITRAAKTAANANANANNLLIHEMMMNPLPKKKKGRPSLADLQNRRLKSLTSPSPTPISDYSTPSRRSSRRPISGNDDFISSEFISDEYDDDDDERKKKKVKLVVRLPQFNQLHSGNSSSRNSGSAYDSEPDEGEDHHAVLQGGTINGFEARSNDAVINHQRGQDLMLTNTQHGSPLQRGPTTPLPDKKLLVFILDRLQKKDTYGVFAEPVDPDELPDYHEIIEHPMDFGTVRKKLDNRIYPNLEELEADVFLICSNAMQYNAPDTVYYRQASTIHELAKRDFANLRHEGEPKLVRRGRPPRKNVPQPVESSPADRTEYKNVKKVIESSPVDRAGIQLSSGATLASGEDKANGSYGYNLRKGSMMYRFHSNDVFATNHSSRNGENYSDWLVDWNSEFPAKILKADMKLGKKHVLVDENRRDTYKEYQVSASSAEQQGLRLSNTSGDRKQLIPVGLHLEPHGYARSIARFAANLGPVAWKVASMKIRSVLPEGTPFGPGWVGEDDAPSQSSSFFACEGQKPMMDGFVPHHDSSKQENHPPGLCPTAEESDEAFVKRPDFQNKVVSSEHDDSSLKASGSSFQHIRNGMYQNNPSSQTGIISRISSMEEGSTSYQVPSMLQKSEVSPINSGSFFQGDGASMGMMIMANSSSSRSSHQQQQRPLSIPTDLNVRAPLSGSPSSSLQIGSPQQPDLALQL